MVAFLQGCSENRDDDTDEYQIAFYWTPDGSGTQVGPFVETYKFKCLDISSYPDCNILIFLDEPQESGNWMSFPEDRSTCSGFDAVVTMEDEAQYFFFGNLMDPLNPGGLRSSGIYDKEVDGVSVETGTFTATSRFVEGGSNTCEE